LLGFAGRDGFFYFLIEDGRSPQELGLSLRSEELVSFIPGMRRKRAMSQPATEPDWNVRATRRLSRPNSEGHGNIAGQVYENNT
jgi:hypothetical protein